MAGLKRNISAFEDSPPSAFDKYRSSEPKWGFESPLKDPFISQHDDYPRNQPGQFRLPDTGSSKRPKFMAKQDSSQSSDEHETAFERLQKRHRTQQAEASFFSSSSTPPRKRKESSKPSNTLNSRGLPKGWRDPSEWLKDVPRRNISTVPGGRNDIKSRPMLSPRPRNSDKKSSEPSASKPVKYPFLSELNRARNKPPPPRLGQILPLPPSNPPKPGSPKRTDRPTALGLRPMPGLGPSWTGRDSTEGLPHMPPSLADTTSTEQLARLPSSVGNRDSTEQLPQQPSNFALPPHDVQKLIDTLNEVPEILKTLHAQYLRPIRILSDKVAALSEEVKQLRSEKRVAFGWPDRYL